MQDNCSGTARLDIRKKCIESKAPHSHKSNDKSSMIKNFYKKVRIGEQGEDLPSENKISRTTIQSEKNPESQELGIDFYADETSDAEQSSEFNFNKDSLNLEIDKVKENSWDFQIPEIGKNYSTIKSGRAITFHHEGYNYCRSQINTDRGLVFLRFVIPQFLSFFIHNFYLYSSYVSKRETDINNDRKC